ncbi:15223_t:CDS:2, partial [Rhizophagus irregularis]
LNFYITNHAKQGNQLFYYRQEIWSRMVKQNLITLTSSVYEKISPENEIRIFKDKKLGYSKLKFIPKDNKGNLRPIVNMKRPMHTSVNEKQPKSINAMLNTTFQILKHEKEKNPSLLTGSVFSYNEVHACLKEYKQHLANENNPQLYFAKVDIKCCFETIDQNILIEIIRKEVLTENKYSVNKYEATYLKGGTVCRKRDYYVHDSSEILSFPKYSAKLTQNYKNAILIDSAYRSYKEVDDVFKLLEEHI